MPLIRVHPHVYRLLLLLVASALTACVPSQPFVVDVPLRVVATEPSGAATGVSRNVEPRIHFSEALLPPASNAVQLWAISADESMTPLAVDLSFATTEDGEHVLTVSPRIRLAPATRHRLAIGTLIRRARDGAPLPTRVTLDFLTETPPPLDVVGVTPGDGAAGVSVSPRVSLRFSEPPRCPLEGVELLEIPDPVAEPDAPPRTLAGSWTCVPPSGSAEGEAACTDQADADPCRVTFVADATKGDPVFGHGGEVRLWLRGAEASDEGPVVRSRRSVGRNGLLRRTWETSFFIAHPPPLLLERTDPPDGAAGVSPSQVVTLWFSEPPLCGNALATGVTVVETLHPTLGGGERVVPGEWTCPPPLGVGQSCADGPWRCAVRFTAASSGAAPYLVSSNVRLELRGGSDPQALRGATATSQGGRLPAPRTVTFRIQDPPPLLVVDSTPRNGDEDAPADTELVLRFNQPVDHASVIPCEVDEAGGDVPADCNALLRRVDVAPGTTVSIASLCEMPDACADDEVRLVAVEPLESGAKYRLSLERIGDAPRPAFGEGVLGAPFEVVFHVEPATDE